MEALREEQWLRLAAAREALREWNPRLTAPDRMARSLSMLHGGLPSVIYTISKDGGGDDARAALAGITFDQVSATPFMQNNLIFAREFTLVTEEESLWGAENRAIMGEDLVRDAARWQSFEELLLRPLELGDNLRIIFSTTNGRLLGWCGSFTIDGRRFGENDRFLLDTFAASLADVIHAWDTFSPAFEAKHPTMQMARKWLSPVFATTANGNFLYANEAACASLKERPEWLDEALRGMTALPRDWYVNSIPSRHGSIAVFMQGEDPVAECWFEHSLVERLQLPAYLEPVATLLMKGLTNAEIARTLSKPRSTIDTYVGRILRHVGVDNRTELLSESLQINFKAADPWPVTFRRASSKKLRR